MADIGTIGGVKDQKDLKIFSFGLLVIVLVTSVIIYSSNIYKKSELKTKQKQVEDLNLQISSTNLADYLKYAEVIQSGIGDFNSTYNNRLSYYTFFNDLSSLLPKDVKLNNFSLREDSEAKIDGDAQNYNSVALLQSALETSEMMSSVKLISANKTEGDNSGKVSFSISFKINTK